MYSYRWQNNARTNGSVPVKSIKHAIRGFENIDWRGVNHLINFDAHPLPPPLLLGVGHAEVVKLLVKAHALVDKANQKGTTALMRATQEGNEEVVRILVNAGADVSKRNNERMNALMLGSQVKKVVVCSTFFLSQDTINGLTKVNV